MKDYGVMMDTEFTRMMMPVMTAVRQDINKACNQGCADTVVRLVQRQRACMYASGIIDVGNFNGKVEQQNVSVMCNVALYGGNVFIMYKCTEYTKITGSFP